MGQGTAEEIITAPPGRWAVGMMSDPNATGSSSPAVHREAYVYDINRRETLRTYQFAPATVDENAPTTLVNDVALTLMAPGSPTRCPRAVLRPDR